MRVFSSTHRLVTVALMGFAGVALAFAAQAATPIAVTFEANNPWTQQIGSITRDASSLDYAVAVVAGKTLQINLITRNPNLYFKVKSDAHRKWLTDTIKTGATTWSTEVAEAATYTIEVYAQPGAIGVGETAKFALQVGQYGQQDYQPATTAVTFENQNPWAQFTGTLDATGIAHDYTVAIAAGRTLAVNLVTPNPKVHFSVTDQASHQVLIDNAQSGVAKWSAPIAAAATYTVKVYIAAADVPPGKRVGYSLQIGQYQQAASPAPAGTADAAPAAAASAGSH
jgi:hypothetical protein